MLKKRIKLADIAILVQGDIVGDTEVVITGVADLASAESCDITFIADVKSVLLSDVVNAGAVIVPHQIEKAEYPIIRVSDPYLAITIIHNYFLKEPFVAGGISAAAEIGCDCLIGDEVSIAPKVVLGARVRLGERVTLSSGVVLADDVVVGNDTALHANVTVYAKSLIGNRVIIHSGAVIGSDGFGYVTDENGHHLKRPHVGIVQIDDDVEIGANVCIDRGTFGRTWVQRGVKIDNLVQIAHNVVVGEHSILVAQSGIAGSTSLGRGVMVGGQTAIAGHLNLGDRVMIAGKSGVHNDQKSGAIIAGMPAIASKKWLRASAVFARLPEILSDVRKLKKKLTNNN